MIVEIWSQSVPNRIQDCIIGEISAVGIQEVAFSTWGGKIYLCRGEDGKRKWETESFTYPPSSLNLFDICGERYLLGSFADTLRLLDTTEGKKFRDASLDSVILQTNVSDITGDGHNDIVVYTKGNQLYVLDDTFEVLWNENVSLSPSPSALLSCDVDYNGRPELLVGNRDSFFVFSHSGDLLLEKDFSDRGDLLSIAVGHFTNIPTKEIVLGSESGLSLIRNYEEVTKTDFEAYPYLLTSGDVDGDGKEEIVLGDWKEDSIFVFESEKKSKLQKLHSLPLNGNPTSLITADIEIDGKEEILTVTDKESFKIFRGEDLLEETIGYPGPFNVHVGNLLGRGDNDILVQNGRERLTLLTYLPRVSAPSWIKEGDTFNVYTLVESGSELTSQNPKLSISNKEYLERKKLESGYVSWYRYECEARNPGSGYISIEEGSTFPIQIARKRTIKSNTHVWITDEDFAVLKSANMFPQSDLRFLRYKQGMEASGLWISSPITGTIPLKDGVVHIERSAEVVTPISDLILSNTTVSTKISNRSARRIHASFRGNGEIKVDAKPFTIPPEGEKKVELKLQITMGDEKKRKVSENLRFTYTGLDAHTLFLPINTLVINEKWARDYIETMKEKIGEDKTLTKMSMQLHIAKDLLIDLFSSHGLLSTPTTVEE